MAEQHPSTSGAGGSSLHNELPVASNMVVRAASDELAAGLGPDQNGSAQALASTAPVSQPAGGVRKRKAGGARAKTEGEKAGTRAKSGCYTCRIRRKKCDERINDNGACETCVRLRLQCLGFGPKRPEWLRSQANVTDLRNRIKDFLASQGMIKGHANNLPSGRTGPELSPTSSSAAEGQSPNHAFSVVPQPALNTLSDDPAATPTGYRTIQMSSVRDKDIVTLDPALASGSSSAAAANHNEQADNDDNGYTPIQPQPYNSTYASQNSASSPPSFLWLCPPDLIHRPPVRGPEGPTLILDQGGLIAMDIEDDELDDNPVYLSHPHQQSNAFLQLSPSSSSSSGPSSSTSSHFKAVIQRPPPVPSPSMSASLHLTTNRTQDFLTAYRSSLLSLQFLMGDPAVRGIILTTLESHQPTAEAAGLLGRIAWMKMEQPRIGNVLKEAPDVGEALEACYRSLSWRTRGRRDPYGERSVVKRDRNVSRGEAILALMAVSVFLFAGGQYFPPSVPFNSTASVGSTGQGLTFKPWVEILLRYTKQVLGVANTQHQSNGSYPRASLSGPGMVGGLGMGAGLGVYGDLRPSFEVLNDADKFIVITSLWFDTISSVTSQEPPLLADINDALLSPYLPSSSSPSLPQNSTAQHLQPFQNQTQQDIGLGLIGVEVPTFSSVRSVHSAGASEYSFAGAGTPQTQQYDSPYEPSMDTFQPYPQQHQHQPQSHHQGYGGDYFAGSTNPSPVVAPYVPQQQVHQPHPQSYLTSSGNNNLSTFPAGSSSSGSPVIPTTNFSNSVSGGYDGSATNYPTPPQSEMTPLPTSPTSPEHPPLAGFYPTTPYSPHHTVTTPYSPHHNATTPGGDFWSPASAQHLQLPHQHQHQHQATQYGSPQPILTENVMGASSLSLWAISRTTLLCHQRSSTGSISNMDLVLKSQEVLSLLQSSHIPGSTSTLFPYDYDRRSFNHVEDGGLNRMQREREVAREVSMRVFNAGAKLYVKSVAELDRVGSVVVREGVEECIDALRSARDASTLPAQQHGGDVDDNVWRRTSLPVIRSLYFPLFLCGALTNDPIIRAEVEEMLLSTSAPPSSPQPRPGPEPGGLIGNAPSILVLLQGLWKKHSVQYRSGEQVNWRDALCAGRVLLI